MKKLIDIKNSALIVIDMQNYLLKYAKKILPNVNTIINACREVEIPIFFTQHGQENINDCPNMIQWWGNEVCIDTFAFRFISGLNISDNDIIINKKTYSAFYNTELNNILKKLNKKEIIITGALSNICCETTAREAFVRGYRVFFVSDANSAEKDEYHKATLLNLEYCAAYIKNTSQIIGEIKKCL